MKLCWFYTAILTLLIGAPGRCTTIWNDILLCVNSLDNHTTPSEVNTTANNGTSEMDQIDKQFSMMKLFSIICGNRNAFVRCLDTSLKQSSDSMAQIIGSFFDPKMVTKAYDSLCANISAIEQAGSDVLSCLSKVKMTHCQSELADYFFYMGVVKKFAPPSEQLSKSTMETLLCSVIFQRRQCEVLALRQCSANLANVMEQFYRQTQPGACANFNKEISDENNVQ
ncbi:hypothetical protein BgiMline_021984 [Biomphalaria glabrata]|uniref:Uncharacterized protein LOC106060836 n=1 Tax=Biomphalaria glabrata TaxID=6526 RepID=A0A9U8E695_BIOGL|nr:uncharacterized protein LOC106060836 [Biomphalaria glabrata]KAI8756370.1 hypothetical protein BgiMline_009885 [Biomphalaria glabrata]KAI8797749.1 hypothetical protein BgiBS90_000052 [Biomphalaria glabrata]